MSLAIGDVVVDMAIYPRAGWSQATVDRYAEAFAAGEAFPPIILEHGTNRLLDGMHRYRAHRQAGLAEVNAEHHEIPAGVPPKLYAASLSARHGDRMTARDLQAVAREIAQQHPDYSLATVARYCGVTRQTVGRWIADITERRRLVRKVRALLLSRLGWTQTQIADGLGVGQASVSGWLSEMSGATFPIAEDLLREATDGTASGSAWVGSAMDFTPILEAIREERIFACWPDDERILLERLRDGEIVVANLRSHERLIGWAEAAGLFVRIDRQSGWGNPFELGKDGDRETVVAGYEQHYLPHKPSLVVRLPALLGKALGCWCAPERCHGDVLKRWAER